MRTNKTPEGIWKEYIRGVDYNTQIDLYETVKKNENFFIGKQWEGVNAPDLEKPVLNFLKRVTTYFISMIVSDDVAASLTPMLPGEGSEAVCKILSNEIERVIERTNAKSLNREMLRNAVVDGDACFYLYFDPELQTGQQASGEICIDLMENTKVLFGNPYVDDVQRQPYLILVKRDMLESVQDEAQKNGVDPETIRPDSESKYYNEEKDANSNLVTVLIKLWKENGTVRFLKTTQEVVLKEETDTGYKLYPVAYMSWDKIRNSYHGQAAITGLIPNQIFINKLWAMAMEHQKKMAFPKLFYDMTKIREWTNKVGQAIGVVGNPNEAVASSFRAQDMSSQVLELVEKTISYTRDFMGASDAALGNVKPDNTSAIIAVQKASSAPLELQRMAFYQFVEDYVRIILDMIRVNYGLRQVGMTDDMGNDTTVFIDFNNIDYDALSLKVDVGSSSYWSELTQIQTLDNLFTKGIITDAVTYLEGIPDQYIKNKNKIIAQLKERQQMQEEMLAMQAQQGGMPMRTGGMSNGTMPVM